MNHIIFNDYLDATLAGLSVAIVVTMVVYAFFDIRKALSDSKGTAIEIGGASGDTAGGGNG
jgi:carbon starvation protein